MRVAILLCGHIRSWNDCKQDFINTFGNADVFVHTYNTVLGYHPFIVNQCNVTENSLKLRVEEIKQVIGIPCVDICVEDQDEIENMYIEKYPLNFDTYAQYRKYKLCDELCVRYEEKIGIKYDLIIKTRFDLKYSINLQKMVDAAVNTSLIYISSGTGCYPCDCVFIASRNMTKYFRNVLTDMSLMCGLDKKYSPHEWVSLCANGKLAIIPSLVTEIVRNQKYALPDNKVYEDPGYIQWQRNRVNYIVSLYGKDFLKGKKILELGSYEGGITQMFYNLGTKITGVEGSDRNINICRSRYPHITFIQYDCEKMGEWVFDDHYDIIIHWGLLYHLKNVENSIDMCLKHSELLFLESLVMDNLDSELNFTPEDNIRLPDQSIHGLGTRPTVKYVENILNKYTHHTYVRHDNPALNSFFQPPYDLPVSNTGELRRKFWIIRRKLVFFDVGCHDGKEFFEIAKNYPKDVVIYGFEPTPWAADAIKEKVKNLQNFHVIQKAISDKEGIMDMIVAASDKNKTDSGCNSLHDFRDDWKELFPNATPWYGKIDKIPVEVVRLDNFMKEYNITHVNYLHVDAQGEDLNVVKSLGDRKKDVYEGVIELATNKIKTLYKDNPDLADGIAWMHDNGFVVVQITPNDPPQAIITTEHNLRFKRFELENPAVLHKTYYTNPYIMNLLPHYKPS